MFDIQILSLSAQDYAGPDFSVGSLYELRGVTYQSGEFSGAGREKVLLELEAGLRLEAKKMGAAVVTDVVYQIRPVFAGAMIEWAAYAYGTALIPKQSA